MRFHTFSFAAGFMGILLFPSIAAGAVTSPAPAEDPLLQQWDTECRATFPFGQGDLEPAMVELLRKCITEKRHAKEIADQHARDLLRESDRSQRETLRRETVLTLRRRGFQDILDRLQNRKSQQGKKDERVLPTSHTFRKNRTKGSPSTFSD